VARRFFGFFIRHLFSCLSVCLCDVVVIFFFLLLTDEGGIL
jgi:hypothetical protein